MDSETRFLDYPEQPRGAIRQDDTKQKQKTKSQQEDTGNDTSHRAEHG